MGTPIQYTVPSPAGYTAIISSHITYDGWIYVILAHRTNFDRIVMRSINGGNSWTQVGKAPAGLNMSMTSDTAGRIAVMMWTGSDSAVYHYINSNKASLTDPNFDYWANRMGASTSGSDAYLQRAVFDKDGNLYVGLASGSSGEDHAAYMSIYKFNSAGAYVINFTLGGSNYSIYQIAPFRYGTADDIIFLSGDLSGAYTLSTAKITGNTYAQLANVYFQSNYIRMRHFTTGANRELFGILQGTSDPANYYLHKYIDYQTSPYVTRILMSSGADGSHAPIIDEDGNLAIVNTFSNDGLGIYLRTVNTSTGAVGAVKTFRSRTGTDTAGSYFWSSNGHNGTTIKRVAVFYNSFDLNTVYMSASSTNNAPNAPVITSPTASQAITTRTPNVTWTFTDTDAGDTQSAFLIQIVNSSYTAVVWDSGWIAGSGTSYAIPSGAIPSDGTYYIRMRVRDTAGVDNAPSTGTPAFGDASFYNVLVNVDTVAPVIASVSAQQYVNSGNSIRVWAYGVTDVGLGINTVFANIKKPDGTVYLNSVAMTKNGATNDYYYDFTALTIEGNWWFDIYCNDLAGNWMVGAKTAYVFKDSVTPTAPTQTNGILYATSNGVSWSSFSDGANSSGLLLTTLYLQVWNGSAWTNVAGYPKSITGLTAALTGLTPGTQYRWGVTYTDNATNASTLTYTTFTTNTYAVSTISNLSASGYIFNQRPKIKFVATDANDATLTNFQIQISIAIDFSSTLLDTTSGASSAGWGATSVASGVANSYTPQSNITTGTRYIRVRAFDGKDWGLWSTTIPFTIQAVSWETVLGVVSNTTNFSNKVQTGLTNFQNKVKSGSTNFVDKIKTATTNFVGKVSGSTAENANKAYVPNTTATSLQAPSSGNWYEMNEGHPDAKYSFLNSLNAQSVNNGAFTNGAISQELFSFNLIEHVIRTYGVGVFGAAVTTAERVAWLKANVITLTGSCWAWGSSPLGNKASFAPWRADNSTWWSGYTVNNNSSSPTKLNRSLFPTDLSLAIDSNGFTHWLVYADASNGTTPSFINTDYVELVVDIAGTTWNPNKAYRSASAGGTSTPMIPSNAGWIEFTAQSGISYPLIYALDGQLNTITTSSNTSISQHMFSFDLIEYVIRNYGVGVFGSAVTTAERVVWLKTNIFSLTCNWHGWGSSAVGNKVSFTRWGVGGAWVPSGSGLLTHTNGIVTKLAYNTSVAADAVDANGFCHFIAYADGAGTVANPTTAPTLSVSGSGSGLAAGTYYLKYVWAVTSVGTTLPSPEASITITAGQNIVVTTPSLPFGVSYAEVYISTTTNTETYQGVTTGNSPPTYTRTTALAGGQAALPVVNSAVLPSVINTDYAELLVDIGGTYWNPNKSRFTAASTLIAPSGSWADTNTSGYDEISSLNGVVENYFNGTSGNIIQHLLSFDLIEYVLRIYGPSVFGSATSTVDRVAWLKANIIKLTGDWYGFGSSKTGYKSSVSWWNTISSAWSLGTAFTLSTVTKHNVSPATPSSYIDSNGFVHVVAHADAAAAVDNPTVAPTLSTSGSGSGLAAGTYYVRYNWVIPDLTSTLVSPESSITITAGQNISITIPSFPFGVTAMDIFIGTSTGTGTRQIRTPIATNPYIQTNALVVGNSAPSSNTAVVPSVINTDYIELSVDIGRSTYWNPNVAKFTSGGALVAPSGSWTENGVSSAQYSSLQEIDGFLSTINTGTSPTSIAQQLLSFDLISILERKYGTSLGATLANKVAWVKANVTRTTCNWHGWGSSKSGYKASLSVWSPPNTSWTAFGAAMGSASTVAKLSQDRSGAGNTALMVDNNGFIHYNAYAESAGTVANPTVAPTLSASGSGSGLAAGTYYVTYTWANVVGQSLVAPQASITITTGQNINVTVPTLPFGIDGGLGYALVYIGTATGTGTRQGNTTGALGVNYTQSAALNTGSTPISSLTTNTAIIASTINTDYAELIIESINAPTDTTVSKRTIDEIRIKVNAVRAARGLASAVWTDSIINDWNNVSPTRIRTMHLIELRQAITDVYTTLAVTPPTWTDEIIDTSIARKGQHWIELRNALVAI